MTSGGRTAGIVHIAGVCSRYGGVAGAGEGQSTISGSAYYRDGAGEGGCSCVGDVDCARWSSARSGYGNGYYNRSTSSRRIG